MIKIAYIVNQVLHMDRNDYYGGESSSLNLIQIWLYDRKYGLDDNTIDFIGHAIALHRDDCYLNEPAIDTVKRMKLYSESIARFQGGSPYIYPLYGLGELPQVEFDEEGKAVGVTSEGETARCKKVVCDPSYLPNKGVEDKNLQIFAVDQWMFGRYLFCCSYSHNVAPKGKFIAFVSTEAETDHPESELKPGIDLLGPSYDATTHFESTVMDVLNMYTMITGKGTVGY
ncbi:Guanosine nucleotide diphosphate dissociation inhibitor 2 [Vitis vinifera]|uniref:Guanosine nucleotide diphosphate dissociation inhibitor 2 n=1 Tax=Vitis vinifera TaxID=29760 RepID=A0A438CBJ7_VITVI|nr:Guanosine nucleotide diphosphate dissociation inhibitor 2 [Vitis vinifera]